MVSVSSSGQTGPETGFAGYAPLFGAWGGLGTLTGYEDGPPVEMRHVMDHSVGLNAALATLAALLRRRRTGEGAHADVAAREVAASEIGEALLLSSCGEHLGRQGNAVSRHGAARCVSGRVPRYLADDRRPGRGRLVGLLRVMHREGLGADRRFIDLPARLTHREALDEEIAAWARTQNADVVAALLQAAGVAAHASWDSPTIVADKHLRAPEARSSTFRSRMAGSGLRLERRCASPRQPVVGISRPTPALGEREDYVFGELLGLSRSQRSFLEEKGAIR